ncbi:MULTISPECIES: DUF1266 domain-containing protein [unclassified Microbacterium]|uniref:DUF1266 domain-containing protein n=1 Tax=unclassified Microbacterium TaxID=2609290 RepID=UPI001604B431|nr:MULTISPECIES: DUF1266 domain-containing protein [unclassified Microbacterium]QNA91585.1 DUF1266 domain-containing protein [Microbacterium sp. Se63.02b]QYM64761.1 DUF1266 domain-containing protein [Microbacterium sp. Se5.02b]
MHSFASVDFNSITSIFEWLISQWWVWAVVGAVVLFFLVVWILPDAKVKAAPEFTTTDTEADEIALGFLQIVNLPSGLWNDPKASLLGDREKKVLVEQWGVHTRGDWLANIERLTGARRRREVWMLYLAVRAELAERLGRTPKAKEWLAAIVQEGGDKRDARTFVTSIEYSEAQVRKRVGKDVVTPDLFVRTLDGYALGQAVAMTTWGVALGHGDVTEARGIIHRINEEGRPAFTSWADFGLSYLVGRVMHWSDGNVDEKSFEKFGDGWSDFKAAMSEKRNGPWATLPWSL